MERNERHIVTMTANELQELLINAVESRFLQFIDEMRKNTQQEEDLTTLLITRQQVAKMFNVSTVSLDKWKRAGILPKSIKMAGKVYYLRKEILQMIDKRKAK